ncbi:hypothetical protein [Flavobacterium sp.]|uniref:hypothetical protein n=1 Tax=Flavobacterium sp. TaxID=239 RepID=UPI00260F3FDB|nr:hypothetical protein [Flavobacterium sp.]
MQINDERVKKKVTELSKIQDELREKHFSWLKNVITLAVGLFGIIISLKSDNKLSEIKHLFFIMSIASLGLGIILGIAVLYSEVHVISETKKVVGKQIIQLLDDEKTEIITNINPNKIYKYLQITSILAFLIAIISLILYSSFQ